MPTPRNHRTTAYSDLAVVKSLLPMLGSASRDFHRWRTNEKLNSVKFTWRFAENRPKVAVPESPGIFNDKYNPTFS